MFNEIKKFLLVNGIQFTENQEMFDELFYKGSRLTYGEFELEDISLGNKVIVLRFENSDAYENYFPIADLEKFKENMLDILKMNDIKLKIDKSLGNPMYSY